MPATNPRERWVHWDVGMAKAESRGIAGQQGSTPWQQGVESAETSNGNFNLVHHALNRQLCGTHRLSYTSTVPGLP